MPDNPNGKKLPPPLPTAGAKPKAPASLSAAAKPPPLPTATGSLPRPVSTSGNKQTQKLAQLRPAPRIAGSSTERKLRPISKEELFQDPEPAPKTLQSLEDTPAGWKAMEPGELGDIPLDFFSETPFSAPPAEPQPAEKPVVKIKVADALPPVVTPPALPAKESKPADIAPVKIKVADALPPVVTPPVLPVQESKPADIAPVKIKVADALPPVVTPPVLPAKESKPADIAPVKIKVADPLPPLVAPPVLPAPESKSTPVTTPKPKFSLRGLFVKTAKKEIPAPTEPSAKKQPVQPALKAPVPFSPPQPAKVEGVQAPSPFARLPETDQESLARPSDQSSPKVIPPQPSLDLKSISIIEPLAVPETPAPQPKVEAKAETKPPVIPVKPAPQPKVEAKAETKPPVIPVTPAPQPKVEAKAETKPPVVPVTPAPQPKVEAKAETKPPVIPVTPAPSTKEPAPLKKNILPQLAPPKADTFKFPDKKPAPLFSRRQKPEPEPAATAKPAIPPATPAPEKSTPGSPSPAAATPATPALIPPVRQIEPSGKVVTSLKKVSKPAEKQPPPQKLVLEKLKLETKPESKKAPKPVRAPLSKEVLQKRYRLIGMVVFYLGYVLVLSFVYYGALRYIKETRMEAQVIPPEGMLLSNQVWIVSDFRDNAYGVGADLADEHASKQQEIAPQQDRLSRVHADVSARQQRLQQLKDQESGLKDQIAKLIKDSRLAVQALWDGAGTKIEDQYQNKLTEVENKIADRARSLKLPYQTNDEYRSPDVWASAYRLSLYQVPPGVDSAKEHQWLDQVLKDWRAFTKSLDDQQKDLQAQAADLKAAPTSKIADINAQINDLERRITSTQEELNPILNEEKSVQSQLDRLKDQDAAYERTYYNQLIDIPEQNISSKTRFTIEPKTGRFSWRRVENEFSHDEKIRRFWLFVRAMRPSDGTEFWAMVNVTLQKDNTTLVTIEPGAFMDVHHFLHPDQPLDAKP